VVVRFGTASGLIADLIAQNYLQHKQRTPRAATPGVRIVHRSGEQADMTTLPQALPPRQMAAARAALMRWYPTMPLRLIDALRLHRPGYPLMAGGKAKQGSVRA
jgi:hypothetical protein